MSSIRLDNGQSIAQVHNRIIPKTNHLLNAMTVREKILKIGDIEVASTYPCDQCGMTMNFEGILSNPFDKNPQNQKFLYYCPFCDIHQPKK